MEAGLQGLARVAFRHSRYLGNVPIEPGVEGALRYLFRQFVDPSLKLPLSVGALGFPHVPVPMNASRAKERDKIGAMAFKLIITQQSSFMLKEHFLRVLHVHHATDQELIHFDAISGGCTSSAGNLCSKHFWVA